MKALLGLSVGAVLGSVLTYVILKKKIEVELEKEKEELREYYSNRRSEKEKEQVKSIGKKIQEGIVKGIASPKEEFSSMDVQEYLNQVKRYSGNDVDPAEKEHPEEDEPDIFEVDSEDAAASYGYDTIGVTYYTEDGVLCLNEVGSEDENQVIMDEAGLVGDFLDNLTDDDVGDVFYFVNKRIKSIVEMDVVEGSYEEMVLGIIDEEDED